ncbi:MAG: alginate O-acetyltransferase AlgX-related protein [Candidatus Rokuibacteriota bacterium]
MLKRLVLVAAGLLVAVLITELGLRVLARFNAPVRYLVTMGEALERPAFKSLEAYLTSKAPQVQPHRGYLNFWTNALGLHDLEFVVPKPAGRFRIMALGDSFTYGLVPYPDAVMTRLEDALRSACPRLDLDVLNFGTGGAEVWDYKAIVELGAQTFEPDLVLINFYAGNDGPDLYASLPRSRPRRGFQRSYLTRYVRNVIELATGLERNGDGPSPPNPRPTGSSGVQGGAIIDPVRPLGPNDRRLIGPTFTEEKFIEVMWDELRRFARPAEAADPEATWQPTLTTLEVIRHKVAARGSRLAIAIYPSALQVHRDMREALIEELRARPRFARLLPAEIDPQLPNRVVFDYCRAAGIACYDVTPDLVAASRESPEPLYKRRDTHWTVHGNRVVAEAQARWLRDLVCPAGLSEER